MNTMQRYKDEFKEQFTSLSSKQQIVLLQMITTSTTIVSRASLPAFGNTNRREGIVKLEVLNEVKLRLLDMLEKAITFQDATFEDREIDSDHLLNAIILLNDGNLADQIARSFRYVQENITGNEPMRNLVGKKDLQK